MAFFLLQLIAYSVVQSWSKRSHSLVKNMESFLTPLVTALQSNNSVELEMIDTLKTLNFTTVSSVQIPESGLDNSSEKRSETHI